MSLITKHSEIQAHMNTLLTHLTDLEGKSRKSSAPKSRASAQLAKNMLMSLRKDIMEHVNKLPTQTRTKPTALTESTLVSPTAAAVEAETPTVEAPIAISQPESKPAAKKTVRKAKAAKKA